MKKITNALSIVFLLSFILKEDLESKEINLLSYQSFYEISLDKDRKIKNTFGQPFIKDANGELIIDWFDNCSSWVSNQRMYVSFLNSSGVGTISDINYSLNEEYDSSKIDFALQVKENNMIVEQFTGSGEKNNGTKIKLYNPKEKKLEFSGEILFPHEHLKKVIKFLGGDKEIISNKVYEGSVPNNYVNISTFINKKSIKEDITTLPKEVINEFWSIRMAYYEENKQTPQMELTARINKQGVVSYFVYDYPEYSLRIKLKKLQVSPVNCR